MIEEQATVVAFEGDYVWVQTRHKTTCGQCSASKGCGTQVLGKVIGARISRIKCLNDKQLAMGDDVIIGLDENALLSGSLLIYFLPLLLMLVLGGIAVWLSQFLAVGVDMAAVIGSVSGLLLGLKFAQAITQDRQRESQYQPVILRKVDRPAYPLQPRFKSTENSLSKTP